MIVDGVCESVQSSSATGTTARFNEREDPFAPLQTEYMQSKFYREHFGLVVSCILLYSYTKIILQACSDTENLRSLFCRNQLLWS